MDAGETRARIDYGLFLFKDGRGAESVAMLEKAGAIPELERVRKALKGAPPAPNITAPGPITFESKPLEMAVRTGATGSKHLIETMIAGVAVFDYDNDGWPDIFVANGATIPSLIKADRTYSNRLFRNNGDGTFSDVTAKSGVGGSGYSMGVAAADFDNDGNVDLFVTGVRANMLYRNRGDGTFEDVTEKAGLGEKGKWAVAAGWFDFDNDGLPDLFVVRYVDWEPAAGNILRCISGCQRRISVATASIAIPAITGRWRMLFIRISATERSRTFPWSRASQRSRARAWASRSEISTMTAGWTFSSQTTRFRTFCFHNEGNGKFREMALEAGVAGGADGKAISAMGVDFRDYDNDGRDDLFITALSNETFPLFRNLGNGQWADMTYPSGIGKASFPWTGWSTGMFDFNNDGWKDIFVAGGHVMDNAERSSGRKSRQPNMVFANTGSGRFNATLLRGESLYRGAAFGDFDRDGRVDVVVTRLNEPPLVLHNTSAAGNWIAIRLIGHKSNRDGIGASLHLISASGEQWNRVTTSVGYGCSSDRLVHFGLGKDTRIGLLEIRWPSGIVQRLQDLAVNGFQTVVEGE